jgi:pyruvate dehydrogenase E2 component (dihydrolipoamide acetyltransferase)
MSATEVTVPDIGDFSDVEVIELLVKPGDTIKAEQSLVTVESDKASMEIPSSTAGKVLELKVKLGDKVKQGSLLALVEASGAVPKPAAAADSAAASPAPAAPAAAVASQAASPAAPPAAAPEQPAASTTADVVVPDIGDFDQVEVIEVLVKPGDQVKKDQSLITLESDKASMEIPSSADGVVSEVLVKVGDKVSRGALIVKLSGAAAATAVAAPAQASPAPVPQAAASAQASVTLATAAPVSAAPAPQPAAAVDEAARDTAMPVAGLPHASPSVRQFARELGVNLKNVTGSADKGRITREDVQNFVKAALVASSATASAPAAAVKGGTTPLSLMAWPSLDFSKYGATETVALSRIKKISGPNLARNWAMIPHVTQFDEADVTELEAFRKVTNEKLEKGATKVTMLAFVMKACVTALRRLPNFNSSLDAEGANLILKKYVHLGFAADTPNGLVVPVIRDCDQKGITQLAKETAELAAKAREGKLSPSEMQGASFTISSLGGVGGTAFTPIINAPEVAILGLSRADVKPHWDGAAFVPRLKLPLSLSYDHRVIDGAQAARFTTLLAELLSDMRRVLL